MFIIFFTLWVVFNGRFSTEIAFFGIGVSALLYAFGWKYLGFSPVREWRAVRQTPRIAGYLAVLITEIVKANVRLTRIVLGKSGKIRPQLVTFRTPLQSRVARTVLADSITLTPGTITVSLKDDEMTVHCLDAQFAEGLDDLVFQRRLLVMEKGGKPHDA